VILGQEVFYLFLNNRTDRRIEQDALDDFHLGTGAVN